MITFTGISSSNTQPNDQPPFIFFSQTILSIFINKLHFDIKHLPPPPLFFVCVFFFFFFFFFFLLFVCFFFCHCLSYLCVLLYVIPLLHELSTFFFCFVFVFPSQLLFLDSPYLVPYMIHTFHHLKLWFK